jgi:hypothetical protein
MPLPGHLCPLATHHRGPLWPNGGRAFGLPATYGHRLPHWPEKGRAPLGEPHPSLASHWPQRDGKGTPSPGPPPTGHLRPPLATPGTPPLPRLSGSGGLRPGRGLFACKGCRYDVARVPYTPLGTPLGLRHRLTGHPYPTSYPTSPLASPSVPPYPHRLGAIPHWP